MDKITTFKRTNFIWRIMGPVVSCKWTYFMIRICNLLNTGIKFLKFSDRRNIIRVFISYNFTWIVYVSGHFNDLIMFQFKDTYCIIAFYYESFMMVFRSILCINSSKKNFSKVNVSRNLHYTFTSDEWSSNF